MQFREQGRKIQCIRSTYDPTSRRSHQKVVATFSRWADRILSAYTADLTEEERSELAIWFEARKSSKAEQKAMDTASNLVRLSEWIKVQRAMTDVEVEEVWSALDKVTESLSSRHPRPDRRPLWRRLICTKWCD